jgi:hypothetical protein
VVHLKGFSPNSICCVFFVYDIKGNTRVKKLNKGVIATSHHLLNNKRKSVLEAKVAMGANLESMDLKMGSMPNSWHIKELLLKNVDSGVKNGWGTQKDCFILYSLDPFT